MDAITLVIAVLGLVLSVASLVWQTVVWRLAGPIVSVELTDGTLLPLDIRFVCITARNSGRGAVQLDGWGLHRKGSTDRLVIPIPTIPNPPMPHTLEPGHAIDFRFELGALREHFGPVRVSVTGWVSLGTGGEAVSKARVVDLT